MRSNVTKKQLTIYIFAVTAVLALAIGPGYWHDANTVRVPILMYHHLSDSGNPGSVISAEVFESHVKALGDAGYTSISFEDLYDYVISGTPLPDRPIILTFDDGYMSVYDVALPILKKYDMKATALIIGAFHGESVYKGFDYLPITPHLGDAEAAEMVASGVFSIQSHSFDMHHYTPYETDSPRTGILRRAGESLDDYIEAFTADFDIAAAQIENAVGVRPFVYSYPFGRSTRQAERLLKDMGVTVTLTTAANANTVVRNSPKSLFGLGRFNVPGDMPAEELLAMIGN